MQAGVTVDCCQGAFFTWKPACLHVQWNPTAGQRRAPVPLCMETPRPHALEQRCSRLLLVCTHTHLCTHVHMGSFTSMGWACLLVVEARHVHDRWASHATTRAPGHTRAPRYCRVWPPLWDTHPGGRAELYTCGGSVLSSCPRVTACPSPFWLGRFPPGPFLLLFLPGPSCSFVFTDLRLVPGVWGNFKCWKFLVGTWLRLLIAKCSGLCVSVC